MCIPRGSRRLRVPEQAPNDRQSQSPTGTKARVGVPQIMKATADQIRVFGDGSPRTLQIVARPLQVVARHYVRAHSLERIEDRESRRVEDDSFPASLAVGQKQAAAIKIHVLPCK